MNGPSSRVAGLFPPRARGGLLVLLMGLAAVLGFAVLGGGAFGADSSEGLGFSVSGNASGVLWPGLAAAPIDLGFSNPNDDGVSVATLAVSIASVTAPNATPGLPCTPADFAVVQFTGNLPFVIPPGASTLQSRGFGSSSWPTVRMLETNSDQSGCAGAAVQLNFWAPGPDGPADTGTPAPTAAAAGGGGGGGGGGSTSSGTSSGSGSVPPLIVPVVSPPAASGGARSPSPAGVPRHPTIVLTPSAQTVKSGASARFTVTVRNGVGVKLTHVTVTDAKAPACGRTLGALNAGRTHRYTCILTGIHSGLSNTTRMSGKGPNGSTITAASRPVTVKLAPLTPSKRSAIAIAITPRTQAFTTHASSHTAGATTVAGRYGSARFKIKVTNRGNVALRRVAVGDKLAKSCARTLGALAPGASRSYHCVDRHVGAGFINVAVAGGRNPAGHRITARSRAHVKVIVKPLTGETVTRTKSGVTVTTSRSGNKVTLSIPDVLFASGQSTLAPNSTGALTTVLRMLTRTYAHGHVTITGYTDNVGTAAYNLGLSQRRATTVTAWLSGHGIPSARLSIAWKGEADPIAPNTNDAGRQKNRRVTIAIGSDHN